MLESTASAFGYPIGEGTFFYGRGGEGGRFEDYRRGQANGAGAGGRLRQSGNTRLYDEFDVNNELESGFETLKKLGYVDGGDMAGAPMAAPAEADAPFDAAESKDDDSADWLGDEEQEPPARETAGKRLGGNKLRREAAAAAKVPATLGLLREDVSGRGFLAHLKQQIGDYRDYDAKVRSPDLLESLLPPIFDPPVPPALDLPWPDEVKALVRSLERRSLLETTPFHFAASSTTTDRRGRVSPAAVGDWLLAKDSWRIVASHVRGDGFMVDWLRGGKRGTWRADWLLGRVRDEKPNDAAIDLPIPWASAREWNGMRDYVATLKELGDDRVELTLTHPQRPKNPLVLTIDRKRAVVLEARWQSDPPQGTTRFSDFVEVAGRSFPTTITTLDAKERVVFAEKLTIEALSAADFATRIDAELSTRPQLVELGPSPKDLDTAKQHVAKNEATLEDLWMVLAAASARGDADEAQQRFAAFEPRVAGRFGVTRIKLALLSIGRRHEELRTALLAQAKASVEKARDPELSLASDLLGLAAPLGAGQEMLELLRALEPVYRRHAERRDDLLAFDQQVIAHTVAMQRPEEAARLKEKAARDWPDVAYVQTAWADALASVGEVDAAIAWLDRVEKENGPWEENETEQLESERQQLLWNGYRLEALVASTEARLRESPDAINPTGLDMYLSALLMLDREQLWNTTVQRWLDEGKVEKPSIGARHRVEVALRHALGQGYSVNWWNHRFTSEEIERLEAAARAWLPHEETFGWALQIVTWNTFRDTPQARAIVAEVFASVEKGVETLPFAELARLLQLARTARQGDEQTTERWKKVDERLLARWKAATDKSEQAILESALAGANRPELMLEVWRTKLARATTPAERRLAAQQIFALRLAGEWSDEAQAECLVMVAEIGKLAEGTSPAEMMEKEGLRKFQRREAILAWYDLVKWAIERRVAHDLAAQPEVNNLPRRKLDSLRDELRKTARLAVRELIAAREAAMKGTTPPPAELPFLELDRIWLDLLLKQKVDPARADALALLDSLIESTKSTKPEQLEPEAAVAASRCATTLLHRLVLEAKEAKEAKEGDAAKALASHDQELAKRLADGIAANHPLLDWRALERARLIVLDHGDELEQRLAEWYEKGDDFTKLRYGRDLAHIKAERNKLDEAATLFEAIAKIDPLPHADWMTLASWYTALARKDDAARAKISAWAALDENSLGNLLNQTQWKLQSRGEGNTTVVDDDVPDQQVALMRKSQWPANWSYQLQNLYALTKDFRLLQCLPEAVLGHTAQGIYPFLERVVEFDKLLDEEATVDRIVAHLASVAPRAKTATDRRALAMLQFIAQYKAAAQKNGAGPHAQQALAALKSAFEREWADGEERLYAALLRKFGAFEDPTLRSEQLRQVRELSSRVAPGSADRLAIIDSLAFLLWNANDHDGSLQLFGAELNAQRASHGGRLPDHANDPLAHYVSYLQLAGEWMAAERWWNEEIKLSPNEAHAAWLEQQLFQTYNAALRGDGPTSLGRGRQLYPAVLKLLLKKLAVRTNEGRATQQVQDLVALWDSAKASGLRGVGEDVKRFAFDGLPATLSLYQYRSGQGMVTMIANSLREHASPAAAVEFLVTRAENEPRWLARLNQSFWDQQSWALANFRHEAGGRLDDGVEQRLLNLVVKELKNDLRFGAQRSRGLTDARWNGTWWQQKQRDFSDAAHELLAEVADDEPAIVRVADYLHEGLKQYDDGISVLLEQKRRGRLSFDPQATLVVWLQKQKRWKESLPLAAELVDKRPDVLTDRIHYFLSLAMTNQKKALESALDATVSRWKEKKLWNEEVIAALAESCLETALPERAAAWFEEAIALHVKASPNRGVGDGVLASYYAKRAGALADLGRTAEAVDSAAGAVVAWGGDQNNRGVALAALKNVLMRAEDLDGYVATLDAEVKKSGLENPTIRKVLGAVYMEKSAWAKAAVQLKEALDVQPNDVETQRSLVMAYDRMKRPDLAVAQLAAALEVTAHDVALASELGGRLVKLGEAPRAERVYTNLVETMAQESESHEALAKVREGQRRLPEAAEQWQQVIRIRSKEPTGYLGLARVLVQQKDRGGAVDVLQKILGGDWESRFGDVKSEARSLLKQAESRSE
jgi:predicted Zn-dependent protease